MKAKLKEDKHEFVVIARIGEKPEVHLVQAPTPFSAITHFYPILNDKKTAIEVKSGQGLFYAKIKALPYGFVFEAYLTCF